MAFNELNNDVMEVTAQYALYRLIIANNEKGLYRCGLWIRIQRPFCLASTRPDPSCVVYCVTVHENLVQQCNTGSLRAVWSSTRETTLNQDRESGSSESGFSARVENPMSLLSQALDIATRALFWVSSDDLSFSNFSVKAEYQKT